jgi:hypothetical protein
MEYAERCSRSFFSEGWEPEHHSKTFFPSIGVTNTPTPTEFFVTACVLETFFKKNSAAYKHYMVLKLKSFVIYM